ncbi:MAG: hypothetical protein ACJAZF_002176 [Granulosicoccus sp.]
MTESNRPTQGADYVGSSSRNQSMRGTHAEGNLQMVARDRIEPAAGAVPTRVFSVPITPFQTRSFNNLAG